MKHKKHLPVCIMAAIVTCTNTLAQSGFIYSETRDTLFSEILKEKRSLNIFLPEGYNKDTMNYPVIYVIDGETRCAHVVPTVRFISSEGMMPKSLIVGIPNVNRNRDLLPVLENRPGISDSADNYIRFFVEELFPYINENYRADRYRMLIGHSFGGLFAMHTLVTQPDAFDSYIMIDPSFWYGSSMMIGRTADFLKSHQDHAKTVYISGIQGNPWHFMGNHAMDSMLKVTAPADFHWKTFAYADENHGSVTFKTVYDGLRFTFSDYSDYMGDLVPANGMIMKDKPYDVAMFSRLKALYYTVDGTRPVAGATKLEPDTSGKATIHIGTGCRLNIVSTTRYAAARMITGEYTLAEPPVPVRKTGKLMNGVRYRAYEGTWDSLPDFSKLKPYREGTLKNFTFPDSAKKDLFAVQYEGFIYADEEGYYDFGLNSDDGARLYIHNTLLMDYDGLHSANSWKSYRIYLTKGYYPIRVDFFEKTGGEELYLEFMKYPWTGQPDGKIPDEVLFRQE